MSGLSGTISFRPFGSASIIQVIVIVVPDPTVIVVPGKIVSVGVVVPFSDIRNGLADR